MGAYNFDTDLARSDIEVDKTMQLIINKQKNTKNPVAHIEKSIGLDKKKDYRVDFVDGTSYRVEQKDDYYCKKSGKIAIEFESRGVPSGIVTTKSDAYLINARMPSKEYPVKIRTIIIAVEVLRELIAQKKYKRIKRNGGDPGSNTHFYLFDWEVIVKYGFIYDER